MSMDKCITQTWLCICRNTYIHKYSCPHKYSVLFAARTKRPASYFSADQTPSASCCICSPIKRQSASARGRCTTRWSSCIIILATSSGHLFLHADAVGSWHVPDDFDRLSLTLVRAAGAAAHDWHSDGQKSSKPAVLTTRPSAASCLIGWWALW